MASLQQMSIHCELNQLLGDRLVRDIKLYKNTILWKYGSRQQSMKNCMQIKFAIPLPIHSMYFIIIFLYLF